MRKYLLYRVLLVPFILVAISIVAFFLSKAVPQDPASSFIQFRGVDTEVIDIKSDNYQSVYKDFNLHKPNFYFSILPNTYPRHFNKLPSTNDRKQVKDLLSQGYSFENLKPIIEQKSGLQYVSTIFQNKTYDYSTLGSKQSFIYPTFKWHGSDNQYHLWFKNLLSGQFGNSFVTGKNVWATVSTALKFTLAISLVAIVLTFIIGIFLGYFISKNPQGRSQKIVTNILFLLYSIPIFWLATILVIYFTTDDYGNWTNIFPSIGIDIIPEASTFSLILGNLEKFILPIFCIFTFVIVYIARMLSRGILDQMNLPYIQTAFSKGLTRNEVIAKHALPNALLPVLTIFISSLSRAISGSVVIEIIFNIPGMGRLLYNAIGMADWNVVFCIIMITAVITVISYIIGDILYAFLDPRIRFNRRLA